LTQKIKQSNQNKVVFSNSLFQLFRVLWFKFNRITNQVVIASLQELVKSLCFKKIYNFNLPLCFIRVNKLLWESLVECLHLWHGKFPKLFFIVFPQLFLLVFLINHMDIGFLVMLYTLPFPWVWNLRKKIKFYLHLKA
jgi:hypothetical protein